MNSIFKDGALIDVHVCGWTGSIMLTPEDMGLDDITTAFKLGRKMLIPEAIIANFKSVENRARHAADYPNGLQFPIGSARFLPKNNIQTVINALTECQSQYESLADNLLEHYDEYKAEMRPIYIDAANKAYEQQLPTGVQEINFEDTNRQAFVDKFMARIEAAYPSPQSIRQRFSMDWTLYEIVEPMNEEAAEEWRRQARSKIGGFIDDVVGQLRSETVNVCTRVANAIKEGQVVRANSIESLRNFIDKFKNLNFVGDTKIEDALENLKTEYLDQTKEQLSEPEMQVQLKRRLIEIAEVASDVSDKSTVTGGYRRKIAWEE